MLMASEPRAQHRAGGRVSDERRRDPEHRRPGKPYARRRSGGVNPRKADGRSATGAGKLRKPLGRRLSETLRPPMGGLTPSRRRPPPLAVRGRRHGRRHQERRRCHGHRSHAGLVAHLVSPHALRAGLGGVAASSPRSGDSRWGVRMPTHRHAQQRSGAPPPSGRLRQVRTAGSRRGRFRDEGAITRPSPRTTMLRSEWSPFAAPTRSLTIAAAARQTAVATP